MGGTSVPWGKSNLFTEIIWGKLKLSKIGLAFWHPPTLDGGLIAPPARGDLTVPKQIVNPIPRTIENLFWMQTAWRKTRPLKARPSRFEEGGNAWHGLSFFAFQRFRISAFPGSVVASQPPAGVHA